MIRHLIALALAFTATPLAAQTVTSATQLVDQTPLTPGIMVSKAVTTPPSKKGTVLFDCGSKGPPFVYAVGSPDNCPRANLDPIVTTPPRDYGGSGQLAYGSADNLHATRAMDAFPLRKGGVTIFDILADQVRTFITPEKGRSTTIDDVTVDRVAANVGKRGIYLRGDSARWAIRGFRIAYIGPSSAPGDIPVGIELDGTAHDILIADGDVGGFVNTEPKGYPNADGISCERGNYRVTIRNVVTHDNTDGGLDCKATDVLLDNVTSARNRYGFRLWGIGRATKLIADSNRAAAIQIKPTTNFTIDFLDVRGARDSNAFRIAADKPGGTLIIGACSAPVKLVGSKANVTLGAGC